MTSEDLALSREELYELIWKEPMIKVGAKLGVSGSYLARVCWALNVPRPRRGHWAKLAAGRASAQPPLPPARPGDELTWRRGYTLPYMPESTPPPDRDGLEGPSHGKLPRPRFHPLILGAKRYFEITRQPTSSGYLRPTKRILVDLTVSETGLDKALAFANELFLALETAGHHVVLSPNRAEFRRERVDEHEVPRKNDYESNLWVPDRKTVVYIGTVPIGLSVIELSEPAEARYVDGKYVRASDYQSPKRRRYGYDSSWTTSHDFPSGRLCLQAYSPHRLASWVRQWRETKERTLAKSIPEIVQSLADSIPEILRLMDEGEREARRRREEWEEEEGQRRRQEAEQRAAKARADSVNDLLRIVSEWSRARRLEEFFANAEAQLPTLHPNARERLASRLNEARELIGSTDALMQFRQWLSPAQRIPKLSKADEED